MKFGSKTLIIPNKLGLYYFISDNKLAKFAFLTPDQVQANESRARQFFQKATLSHTPRPRSATVQLTYSSESGSGKGSDKVRRIAIIPKLEQLLRDPKMTDYDPLLTTKESHQLGFNIDILRAIFDDEYFKQAFAEGLIERKDIPMIKGKQKLLRDFRTAKRTRPESLPSMQQIIAMIVKGTVTLISDIYSDSTAQEILDNNKNLMDELNLGNILSMNRRNGAYNMLTMVKTHAKLFV